MPLLLFVSVHMAAQSVTDQPSLTQVTPPSPNAASLGKFGDIPVTMATGLPQISVPIYSYKNFEGTLSLNISLDYHPGGIKVDEMASDVGAGWNLNAGGAVTRTRRGIPDEITAYGFMNSPSITDEVQGNLLYTGQYYPNYFGEVNSSVYDGQNDIFSYNFAGYTGRFMFGKNGDFLLLTPSNIKVTPLIVSNEIVKFTIVDEQGKTYIFDAVERSDNGSAATYHIHTSAWYLTKIIAPSATDSIVLSYEQEWSRYTAGKFVTMTYSPSGANPPSKTQETSYTTVITNGVRLKNISFTSGITVNFVYDAAFRTDQVSTSQMSRLKQINITDGQYTRGYNLYHDYSVNKLTLKKVLPFSAGGEISGYEFSYYNALPGILTDAQDHWGYYNNNTGDFLPPYHDKYGFNIPGGNRSTDPERVKYGSLTRMKYPTGGYTDFEMEANTAEDPRLSDTTVNIITTKSNSIGGLYVTNTTPLTQSFTFNGDAGTTGAFTVNLFQDGSASGSGTKAIVVQLRNSANAILSTQTIVNDLSLTYKDYAFSQINMSPGTYSFYIYTQNLVYSNYISIGWTEDHSKSPDTTRTVTKNLYIGGLRIKSIKDYDGIHTWPASARTYEYVKKNSAVSSGSLGIIPEYSYTGFYEFWPHNHNEGEFFPDPIYKYHGNSGPYVIVRVSSPTQSLATINGSPVTYSRVVENYLNNGVSNGYKESYFASYPSGGLSGYNGYPFTPPDIVDWGFGELLKEVIYNKDNDSVKTTVNEYQTYTYPYYNNTTRLLNFTSIAVAPVVFEFNATSTFNFNSWGQAEKPIYYLVRTFTPSSGRKDLVKTVVTEYQNGIGITDTTRLVYDNLFNVKTTTRYNSKGEKIEFVKYFPYEYTTSVATTMVAQNMYGMEIGNELWKTIGTTKYLINGMVNQYISTSSGIRKGGAAKFLSATPVLSTSVAAFNAGSFIRDANLFKDFLSFSQYSDKGNVIEQSMVNGMKSAYIYGYNGHYLVAEVSNASYSEVAFSSFEESGKGNWAYSGAPVADAGAMVGKRVYSLSNGAITKSGLISGKSYIVSYWSKNGAATVSGSTVVQGPVRNGWTLYTHTLTAGSTGVTIQGNATIDELRLYPADANMKTFTYQPLYGMIALSDPKSNYAFYEYDGFGRLKVVKDLDGKILEVYDYQYQASITK